MKKILLLFLLFFTTSTLLAQTFTFEGINYNITSTTEPRMVAVAENGLFAGVANIPATVTYNGLDYAVDVISREAFLNCTALTGVTIPESITTLGTFAFSGCTNLSSVVIPASVTFMGDGVFQNSGLQSAVFLNSLQYLSRYSFYNCRQLASVTLPNTIRSIAASAFEDCSALKSITLPNSLQFINENSFSRSGVEQLTFPEGLLSISKKAFYECNALTSIVLPSSLDSIGLEAFEYCYRLKSITHNRVDPTGTSLYNSFVYHYYNNEDVIEISLKVPFGSVALYENHSDWGKFNYIREQIVVGNTFSEGGINYTVSDDTTELTEVNVVASPSFSGAAVIPETFVKDGNDFTVVAITSGAFANNTALTSVVIPNSVRGIGGGFLGLPSAFEHCTGLTSVTLGSGLENIGQGAFAYCTALTTVTSRMQTPLAINPTVFLNVPLANVTLRVPAGRIPTYEAAPVWTDFGTIASPQVGDTFVVNNINYAITAISPALTAAVASNATVTGVVDLPASVTHNGDTFAVTGIATDAFKNASITAITIPSTITSIADGAFANCTALTAVTVNNTVPIAITAAVFTGTTISAASLTVPFGIAAAYEATAVWTDFTIVAPIPAPVVGQTFNFNGVNYVVTKATAPYEVAVGSNIYIAVNPVSIPASVSNAGSSFAVTSIADNAFNANLNIAGTTLRSVLSFTIPNSIKSIGAYAFNGCAFSSFTIPNSVVSIGSFGFGNTRLSSIEIPSSVVSIDRFAFSCPFLTSVHIPSSITSIGDYAFYDCNALQSVTVNWTAPLAIDAIVFDRVNLSAVSLNVPLGTEAAYQAAAVWTDFNPIVEFAPPPVLGQTFTVNGINYIVTKATTPYEVAVGTHTGFVGAANIPATVAFASNSFTVKSISYLAFDQNESLTAVTIPNTVTQISDEAFFGCANLTTATIGTGVTSIGANAFGGCKLTTIDIPSSVVSIGELAFQTNATLTSVKVNWANPITIGADVFSNIVLATVILYVPAGKVADYKASAVWQNFSPIREHGATAVTPTFAAVAPVCAGATIDALPITSVNAIVGTWSPAINNTATTTYTFTPTAGQDATTATLEIVVNATPTAPTASAQNFTVASTVASLVPAPSATINWYDAPLGGTALAATTAIATGTYYVSETNANGCESARTAVEVTVNTTVTPVLNDTFTFNGINYLIVKNTAPYEVVVTATPDFIGTAEIPAIVTYQGNIFGVTAIGVNAFQNASGLTGLIIPNSVIRIATNAFNNCANLGAVAVPNSVISIGNYAFTGCTALTSIEISEILQSIGDGAFDGCTSLAIISLPASLITIGEAAFAGCTGLTAVTVGATTPLVINADVFLTVNLGSVRLNVPAGALAAYQAAAVWQNFSPIAEPAPPVVGESFTSNGLNYTITSATAPYTAEVANNSFFVGAAGIPATVAIAGNTFAVTSIATYAFQNCNGLTAVTVPNSVTSMGIGAFERCTNLVSVSLPTSLTTISSYAFSYCERLTTINIPSSITTIESNAFRECSGLTAISLPNSITSLGHSAFQLCYNLVTVNIPNTLTRLEDYLFESCIALQSIVIPNTVTNIGAYSLKNMGLTAITIPSSVTRIENGALEQNTKLTTLNIPSSVTRIDDLAFSFCTGLRSINVNWTTPVAVVRRVFSFIPIATVVLNVPAGTQAAYAAAPVWSEFIITEPNSNVTPPPTATAQTFCNTASVSNLVGTGTDLKWYNVASAGTALLSTDTVVSGTYYVSQTIAGVESARTSVVIVVNPLPAAPTAAAQNFTVASTVANLVPAPSATIKWYDAATGGTALATTTALATGTYYVSETNANNCESERTSVTVTVNTVVMPAMGDIFVFGGIKYIVTKATLPYEVAVHLNPTFVGAANIPTSVSNAGNSFAVTSIGVDAFSACSGLTSVTIPNSITSIGEYSFERCSALASLNIPNSVTSIGQGAFYECTSLTSVTIPNSITSIGDYTFFSCTGLTSVTIPNSVASIGAVAFYNCTGLTSVTIPNSVTSFGIGAFINCTGLTSVTVNWATPLPINADVFENVTIGNVALIVPSGTTALYEAAYVWTDFGTISEPVVATTTPTFSPIQPICAGVTLMALPTTSTNNITGSWSPAINNVATTTYTFTPTAGQNATTATLTIVVYALPTAPVAVAQNFTVASTVANLVPPPSATIKWYDVATGGMALATTTAIATGTYYVSETNANNCESARTSVPITVNAAINYCRNAVAQLLSSPFAAGTVVRWYTVATGGRALTGAPTPSTTTVGTRLWYVSSVINGIESARETITVNTVALPLQPSSITGTTSVGVLVGSNNTATYTIAFVADAVSYFWTVPSGVDIVDGQGTNKVTLSFKNTSNQAGTIGNISVAAINANGCTGAARASSALKSAIPVAPARITMTDPTAIDPAKAITNVSAFIGTNKVLTLTAAAAATASSYQWELAPGVTQLSGGNTNAITVDFSGVNAGITSLYVGVKAVSGAGMSSTDNSGLTPATTSTARLLKLTATSVSSTTAPTVAGQIAGLCGGVVYNYTTTAVALANRYLITAPAGSIVRSAANMTNNSNSLTTSDLMFTVTYPAGFVATTATPATLEVRAANGVGASSTSRILQLSNAMPTFKTPTGSEGITTFSTARAQAFTVAEIAGATNYNWTVANGAVIASGQGTNTITVDFAAVPTTSLTNTITVVATNTCGVANKTRTLILRRVTPTAARFAAAPIAINTIEIYPNPIVSDFNIDVTATKIGMLEMSIYTLDGVLVRKPKVLSLTEGENHITENAAHLPTGVYMLQLVNSVSNEVITKKLIKK